MYDEVCGISVDNFEYPTQVALKRYAEWSYGELEFDLEKAVDFKYDKDVEMMRSSSTVLHLGRFATKLDVFIIPPERDLHDNYSDYIDTEVHLAIASKKIRPEKPISIFTGHLAVLKAFEGGILKEIGHIGQSRIFFDYATEHKISVPPSATVVTGYRGALEEFGCRGERFGDDCKITNNVPDTLQVCGLVRLNPEEMQKGSGLLKALKPTEY